MEQHQQPFYPPGQDCNSAVGRMRHCLKRLKRELSDRKYPQRPFLQRRSSVFRPCPGAWPSPIVPARMFWQGTVIAAITAAAPCPSCSLGQPQCHTSGQMGRLGKGGRDWWDGSAALPTLVPLDGTSWHLDGLTVGDFGIRHPGFMAPFPW